VFAMGHFVLDTGSFQWDVLKFKWDIFNFKRDLLCEIFCILDKYFKVELGHFVCMNGMSCSLNGVFCI